MILFEGSDARMLLSETCSRKLHLQLYYFLRLPCKPLLIVDRVRACAGVLPHQEDPQPAHAAPGASPGPGPAVSAQPQAGGVRHRHQLPPGLHLLLHARVLRLLLHLGLLPPQGVCFFPHELHPPEDSVPQPNPSVVVAGPLTSLFLKKRATRTCGKTGRVP
jgi:hypothetical protein